MMPAIRMPGALVTRPIARVDQIIVAAPLHPLALAAGRLSDTDLRGHVQLVLTDRSGLTAGLTRRSCRPRRGV